MTSAAPPGDRLPTPLSFRLLDLGLVPDSVLRLVCTLRTAKRLRTLRAGSLDEQAAKLQEAVSVFTVSDAPSGF